MPKLTVTTHRKREILDITEQVESHLPGATGIVCLNVLHTTAALTTADLDPGTDLDMLDAFEALMPKLRYRHPHNPEHLPDHILSSLIGTAQRAYLQCLETVASQLASVTAREADPLRRITGDMKPDVED